MIIPPFPPAPIEINIPLSSQDHRVSQWGCIKWCYVSLMHKVGCLEPDGNMCNNICLFQHNTLSQSTYFAPHSSSSRQFSLPLACLPSCLPVCLCVCQNIFSSTINHHFFLSQESATGKEETGQRAHGRAMTAGLPFTQVKSVLCYVMQVATKC